MATDRDDTRGPAGAGCSSCGAAFSGDQRYCLRCGTRRGPLPPAIAAGIAELMRRDRGEEESASPDPEEESSASPGFMPTPRVAAAAVMGMLAFGVFLGSATSQLAQSAGLQSILLEVSAPPPEAEEVPTEAAAAPPAGEEAEPLPPANASSAPAAEQPAPEEPAPEEPEEPVLQPELEEETLPPIEHVFLVVLGENGFEEAFGEASPAPYLAKTLTEKGELVKNYYAVAPSRLANQVALLSGQGPTPETASECPTYADLLPGTLSAAGQVEGAGCVYPATTPTLPGQLVEKQLRWKAYVEDRATPCAYEAGSRDPFVYFHSLIDIPTCLQSDVGLDQLATDLKTAAKTPALSYIVPNACDAGAELPCEEGKPAGPLAAEEFLQRVVPAIEASPAYKEGGLIAITSAEAPQSGPHADASSCCIAPAYPNLPPPSAAEPVTGPVRPSGGGGHVGLLLLSPFVAPGSVNESGYYNHYSLLLSIEELFELEPLGYAGEIALTGFDSSIYNAEESSTASQATGSSSRASCRDCAKRTPSADHSSPSSSKKPWRARPERKAIR